LLAVCLELRFMAKPRFSAHTPNDSQQWHPLNAHLKKVAIRARLLAAKFHAGEIGYYAGLWHDLGKYNSEFQFYLSQCEAASRLGEPAPRSRVPHAIYGAELAAEKFEAIAQLIYGHHGGLPQVTHMQNRLAQINAAAYQEILQNAAAEDMSFEVSPEASQQLMELTKDRCGYELLPQSVKAAVV
jgi:CRISPR-associated endonuclease/helicase Cas3